MMRCRRMAATPTPLKPPDWRDDQNNENDCSNGHMAMLPNTAAGNCCSAFIAFEETNRKSKGSVVPDVLVVLLGDDCLLHALELMGENKIPRTPDRFDPHRLGRAEVTRRLKEGLTRVASSVPVDEARWEGDRMFFRASALGQLASGQVDVADDHVRVEVTLPVLLQRFAEVAQAAIRNRGNLLLTKKS